MTVFNAAVTTTASIIDVDMSDDGKRTQSCDRPIEMKSYHTFTQMCPENTEWKKLLDALCKEGGAEREELAKCKPSRPLDDVTSPAGSER